MANLKAQKINSHMFYLTDEIFLGNRILISIHATQILSWTILYFELNDLFVFVYLFVHLIQFQGLHCRVLSSLQMNKMKFICMEKKQNPRPPCANQLDKRESSPSVCWEPGS